MIKAAVITSVLLATMASAQAGEIETQRQGVWSTNCSGAGATIEVYGDRIVVAPGAPSQAVYPIDGLIDVSMKPMDQAASFAALSGGKTFVFEDEGDRIRFALYDWAAETVRLTQCPGRTRMAAR